MRRKGKACGLSSPRLRRGRGIGSLRRELPNLYFRFASFIDKIFKGEKPADLPAEQPTKFVFAINLKTAKTLGLTIPATPSSAPSNYRLPNSPSSSWPPLSWPPPLRTGRESGLVYLR